MDLATAANHSSRLRKELDAMHKLSPSTVLRHTKKLLDKEIERLDVEVAAESLRCHYSGDSVSEAKIAVESEWMMLQLSNAFGLTNKSQLEVFQAELVSELPVIKNFHQQLPLTYQFAKRVTELLEEEIGRQQQNTGSEGSSSHGRSNYDELNKSINDAVKTVIEGNKEGATSDLVLEILGKNESITIDDIIRSVVRKRFFEATFALDSKPAPAE